MSLRSLLFVPGDRPDRIQKALGSGADALILDLEDSVTVDRKAEARICVATALAAPRSVVKLLVRINPLGSPFLEADLAAVLPGRPDGLVLPKAEGARDIIRLAGLMKRAGIPILPIATETPGALFQLGSYGDVSNHLMGLSWGAEDLPAAIGASAAREEDGSYTDPFRMVRSLALFAAHAAGVAAIETVYPAFADLEGLTAYAARGQRDGFSGMLAIHPAQVPVINAAFTPSPAALAHAEAIVAAFAANPDAGALSLDGQMIDAPHLAQARALLARARD